MPYHGDAYNIAAHGDNTAKVTDAIEKAVYSLVKLDARSGSEKAHITTKNMVAQCPVKPGSVYTDSIGVARQSPAEVQLARRDGPVLLQDFHLIDNITHHNRERIPERIVHAKVDRVSPCSCEYSADSAFVSCRVPAPMVSGRPPPMYPTSVVLTS
jgi:ABC-type ATPase involved in cell division